MKIKAYLPSGRFKLLTANCTMDILRIDTEYGAWEYL